MKKIKTPLEIYKEVKARMDEAQCYNLETFANELQEAYHSQFESKWISVGESWPKVNERVFLVIDSLGQKYTCIGKRGEDGLFYKDKGSLSKQLEIVTHWMPLPSNPITE